MQLITSQQCKAGRAYLGWSQTDLANESHVSLRAIQDFEGGNRRPNDPTILALKYAMELSSLIFTHDPEGCYLREDLGQLEGIGPDPQKMGWGDQIEREASDHGFYSVESIKKLLDEFRCVDSKCAEIMIQYGALRLKNKEAYEDLHHGFLRRLGTLKQCIKNIFQIYHPSRTDKPTNEARNNIEINLQAFLLNMSGCIDNLAWVWVKEQGISKNGKPLPAGLVGLMSEDKNEVVRASLSSSFQSYLESRDDWYSVMRSYRDGLAHRIPLYVPPSFMTPDEVHKHDEIEKLKSDAIKNLAFEAYSELNAQQEKLGRFIPCMQHSLNNTNPPIAFHSQILANWNTVAEMAGKFLQEIKNPN